MFQGQAAAASEVCPFTAKCFWRAFFFCQCWQMVALTRTSQLRSLISSNKSAVAKNLMPLAGGLPSGLSSRAAISAGMSCGCRSSTPRPPAPPSGGLATGPAASKTDVDLLSFKSGNDVHGFPHRFIQSFQRHLPHVVRHHSVNYFWAHLSTRSLRRRLRARSAAPRPRNPFHLTRATIALAFYPGLRWRIVSEAFLATAGDMPPYTSTSITPCPQSARLSHRKGYSPGNHLVKPRRFRHQPVFSCVLSAASVSTRIDTRYQTDNRCRQRHRVRKAVFVQLVCVCPQALRHVVRSGQ